MGSRPRLTSYLATSALFTALGCKETVALGSECPPLGKTCITPHRPLAPSGLPDGGTPGDGSAFEAGTQPGDAGEYSSDAAGGAPPGASVATLRVANPSFELTAGTEGEVALLESNQDALSPWYTCTGGLSVVTAADVRNRPVGEPEPDEIVAPADADTFVSTTFFFSGPIAAPLLQKLDKPLRKGERYAFVLDIASASGGANNLKLEVWGAHARCSPEKELGVSRTIKDSEGWVSICFAFTPDDDYEELMLQALSTTGLVDSGSRLFFDHLRTDPACK